MSELISTPRGVHDLLPEEEAKRLFLVEKARYIASLYGYEPIRTPIFEFTKVFERSLGEQTDVISKQMYTFEDKGGESLSLRPEGTAGIVRAFLSHKLQQQTPLKFFYEGAMFRYERPQKGRLRQFFQMGVECLGGAPITSEIETIAMASQFLSALGLEKKVKLKINTLGDKDSRKLYTENLLKTLKAHKKDLSLDSQKRLEKNPLRILDSKDEKDIKIISNINNIYNFLNEDSKNIYEEVKKGLEKLNVSYEEDPFLVRGLDYYEHVVFEFICEDLGSQNAVLAGGRYDGLLESLGGRKLLSSGWASGCERLALLMGDKKNPPPKLSILPLDEKHHLEALDIAQKLRKESVSVEILTQGNLKKRLSRLSKKEASYALLIGQQEASSSSYTLKDLKENAQKSLSWGELLEVLK